jgi:hypothetical protein
MKLLISLAIMSGVGLGQGTAADDRIDYTRQIKPVLRARCYACHGILKQKGGLRLDTAALALKGSESQAVIVPGDPDASALIERISATEESERMPPEGEPLEPSEVAAVRAWIAQGASAPGDEQPERDPRDHWAFKTPTRPAVPKVANTPWVNNPIDAFIAREYEERGLRPQPPAERRVWLRRVSLDLTGLPPTPEELDAFVADDSAGAFDTVVERLLASPQYGERWGRHWMDVWRYSYWWGLGAEVRNSQKHIWHWRDWIIESLNADKGYDQMLREMLAADELYPTDPDRLRATGFLARQYFKFNRTSWLDETIEHTSKAMLGLTFNCAKCHDHKYDPITQLHYYQLRTFFEPYQIRTDAVPDEIDFDKAGIPRAFDCNLEAPTFLHVRGDDRHPDKRRVIEPGLPSFLSLGANRIEPVSLPDQVSHPGLRPFVVELYLKAAAQRIAEARTALEAARKTSVEAVEQRLRAAIAEKALIAAEAQPAAIEARAAADRARYQQPPPADRSCLIATAVRAERVAAALKADRDVSQAELEILTTPEKKGEAEKKLAAARAALESARRAIEAPGEDYTPITGALKTLESNLETENSRRMPFPKSSTGRRSALARWITDPKHPLTARVAVNHLWARHFGRALVPTVFDFGRKGTPPTHPALFDWLAVELVEREWSMKAIHRLIVTSNTYRLTSSSAGAASGTLAVDPDNRSYWRANPVRMEAQVVRDSLLHVAGELDLAQGGPSIAVNNEASRRRSLYFVHSHNEHQPFLAMFDDANVLECYRRAESVVPQQALALENSPFATAMAEKIAQRLAAANPAVSDHEFVRAAFLTVLSVEPTEAEAAEVLEALARLTGAARQRNRENPELRAKIHLVLALLNHNDFVTVR